MQFAYNVLFIIAFVLASPYYLWRMLRRGNWAEGFGERFAGYTPDLRQALTNRHVVWIHAVSVGEVNLCTQLIYVLEPRAPNVKFVVSATTTTGMEKLRQLPARISKIYYPIDRKKYADHALAVMNPQAFILVEAEIWPNFLWRAHKLKIPVFLANARLSERSFRGYKRFGFLFRPLFAGFAGVGTQNEEDADRLLAVGCRREAVRVVGNMKFDTAMFTTDRRLDAVKMLRQIGVTEEALVVVAGSTHEGEEILLAEMCQRLRKRFPKLFLVLVPRHFERCKDVGRKLKEAGVKFALRSNINFMVTFPPGELECLLVNTTGELRFFYEPATVVVIGKSLTAQGGQNPIEAGVLGKPVVFGPHMENFTDIARNFVAAKAAVQVADAAGLEAELADLLANPERRAELGRQAAGVIQQNNGAVERTAEMILAHLKLRGVYVAPEKTAGRRLPA